MCVGGGGGGVVWYNHTAQEYSSILRHKSTQVFSGTRVLKYSPAQEYSSILRHKSTQVFSGTRVLKYSPAQVFSVLHALCLPKTGGLVGGGECMLL